MRAIDISPPMLVTIDASATLLAAAKEMRKKGVGDLLIIRADGHRERPVGVITDRDIVVHALACDLNLDEVTVADLSTRAPVSVDADADLVTITEVMKEHGVRRVVVMHEDEIAGIVTLDNVIESMAVMHQNLSEMLTRQLDYEAEHLVSRHSAA
ncbi:MAG: CBS domain-containing protein [Woeseiaceae bacterium]|nr:CBS domain-containing protein [Woeseiaceae bacterium]